MSGSKIEFIFDEEKHKSREHALTIDIVMAIADVLSEAELPKEQVEELLRVYPDKKRYYQKTYGLHPNLPMFDD